MEGFIVENISNLYRIKVNDKIYEASARGRFKKDDITPVVGDIVEIEVLEEEKKIAVIEEIKPRRNYIKRPKMANLTQIVLVVSSKHPKPDLLMLDKQLAFAEYMKVKPIIVLNKIDLDEKNDFIRISEEYTNIGYKVIQTDAKLGIGIDELIMSLKNNVSAFSGNSGVGKSTLINKIFEKNVTQEGEISLKNKKGKNTTTAIKLYELNEDSYIADTPGFSTFDIGEIESDNLDKYFIEFGKYMSYCRYIGCNHIKENECGVKEACIENKIFRTRYENYTKIYNELKDKEEHRW